MGGMGEEKDVSARAVVTVRLEALLPDVWGTKCTAKQVYEEAARSCEQRVQNATSGSIGSHPHAIRGWRMVGRPEVTAVYLPEGNAAGLHWPDTAGHNDGMRDPAVTKEGEKLSRYRQAALAAFGRVRGWENQPTGSKLDDELVAFIDGVGK